MGLPDTVHCLLKFFLVFRSRKTEGRCVWREECRSRVRMRWPLDWQHQWWHLLCVGIVCLIVCSTCCVCVLMCVVCGSHPYFLHLLVVTCFFLIFAWYQRTLLVIGNFIKETTDIYCILYNLCLKYSLLLQGSFFVRGLSQAPPVGLSQLAHVTVRTCAVRHPLWVNFFFTPTLKQFSVHTWQ